MTFFFQSRGAPTARPGRPPMGALLLWCAVALPAGGQPPAEPESSETSPAAEATGETRKEASAPASADEAVASKPTKADDEGSAWTALILDDSLSGWGQVGGNASFTIQRNEIVGVTRPGIDDGFLCTETAYDDFELEVECKVDPGLNSGIVIRGQLPSDASQRQVDGIQVEIDSSPRAWTGSLYDQGAGSWLATVTDVPKAREAFDPTQWNRLRIVAEGPRVRTWVNGVPAVDCAGVTEQAGFIGLQIHRTRGADGLEVRWRRLRIRPVSETTQGEKASDLTSDTDPGGDRPGEVPRQAEPEEAAAAEDQESSP